MDKKDKISIHSARFILPHGKPESWDFEEELRAREMCEEVASAYLESGGEGNITKRSHIAALTAIGVLKNDIPWIAEHLVGSEFYLGIQKELAEEELKERLAQIQSPSSSKKPNSAYDGLPGLENITPEIVLRRIFSDATDVYVPAPARVSAQKLLAKCLGMEAPKRIDAKVDGNTVSEPPVINLTLNATPAETAVKA